LRTLRLYGYHVLLLFLGFGIAAHYAFGDHGQGLGKRTRPSPLPGWERTASRVKPSCTRNKTQAESAPSSATQYGT
jgi:hypothetical protein